MPAMAHGTKDRIPAGPQATPRATPAIAGVIQRRAMPDAPIAAECSTGSAGAARSVAPDRMLQLFADGIGAGVHSPHGTDAARSTHGTDAARSPHGTDAASSTRGTGDAARSTHETAAQGISGAGGPLPHLAQIQRAFGRHEVSGVRAHTGEAATRATAGLGARAFATGNDVVLAPDADLHTVAHEAAHVVQQRSGLSLPGGMGSPGDAHEQHADRVADRVVAGESAEDLLDAYASGGAPAPVAREVQRALRTGGDSPASVAIVRAVLAGENVAAMNALLHACDQVAARRRESAPEHVRCVGGGDTFDLHLGAGDVDTLRVELRARIAALEATATTAADATCGPFATAFNATFAPILGGLRRSELREDRVTEGGSPAEAYSEAELGIRFTANQRALLTTFMTTQAIPDHLFSGDERGTMNAPQRILIAAHILTNGTYQPGTFAQRLHARMCGHWARLVNTYAGVVEDRGTGVEHQLDHEGDLALAGGRLTVTESGVRETLSPEEATGHRLFRQRGIPMATFDSILPGDWLYLYTHTDTPGGNHSVIFGNWTGVTGVTASGARFRRAILFGQSHPSEGGSATDYALGEDYAPHVGHDPTVYPITQVQHYDIDTAPPETVDDLREHELGIDPAVDEVVPIGALPELGTGPDAEANFTLIRGIERRLHGRLDFAALRAAIRARNEGYLSQLASRATDGQLFLLRATNERDDFDTLVRLNERLGHMVHNVDALHAAETSEAATRVDTEHDARAAEAATAIAELEAQIAALNPDLDRARAVEVHDVRLRSLHDEISRTQRWRSSDRHALAGLARSARTAARRATLENRIAEYTARLEKLERDLGAEETARAEAAATELAERETAGLGRPARSHELVARLERRQEVLREQIDDLDASTGFHTAHPGSADTFHGRVDGEREARLTGQLANVTPALDWTSVVRAGETPVTEGAASPRALARRRHRRPRGR